MSPRSVNGIAADDEIVKQFVQHFASACTNDSASRAEILKANYMQMRANYCGLPDDPRYSFDAELVENVILKMKRGKAAGLDGITLEHLRFSHWLLSCVLSKLYNFMLRLAHVPYWFGLSYTVPVIKNSTYMYSKTITVDDFRGVSISPVLSKVLEHCILDRYCDFLGTSDNQFGFKRGLSCSSAIFTLRTVVDHYVNYGSTVNVCSLDLSKAFDRMNHHALFIKLMKRNIPVNLLSILELWFSVSMTCVKWGRVYSDYFSLLCGVRQGGVLSPCLFTIFIDSVVDRVRNSGLGCHLKMACFSILLYADDIVLLAPSVHSLQLLLRTCEDELSCLDMRLNNKKSVCIRIGPRYKADCCSLVTSDNCELRWCNSLRYLGVYIMFLSTFRCSFSYFKQSTYRAFNALFGRVGRATSADAIVQLFKMKCLPVLL